MPKPQRRVRDSGVETFDDVRSAGRALVGFSDALAAEERELKRFLYAQPLRRTRAQCGAGGGASGSSSNLAAAYRADPSLLPEAWRRSGDRLQQLRTISDFIAGMTDRYAISRHLELVGPVNLPADRF